MRHLFPLFQSHLDLSHHYWHNHLRSGDSALDATCGNGHDTLVLARLLFPATPSAARKGQLHILDVQPEALVATQKRLTEALPPSAHTQLHFHLQCHSSFPPAILPATLNLIVYNLGYLPGGNKQRTTRVTTTLLSLQAALPLLKEGGCISLTAYPGHPEGKEEEEALMQFCTTLPPQEWNICHHRFCNRRHSPSLFLIQYRKILEPCVTPP